MGHEIWGVARRWIGLAAALTVLTIGPAIGQTPEQASAQGYPVGGYTPIGWAPPDGSLDTSIPFLDWLPDGPLVEAQKPAPDTTTPDLGNDSCRWANDLECDDARFGGTGYCTPGTDASDCRALAMGGDNSCRWAFDGECDEPGIGLGVCTSGTDTADCAPLAERRNRDNSCQFAFNDVCDEQGVGGAPALCAIGSDTADCLGRETPAAARDHHFGFDSRILPDVGEFPWRAIGQIEFEVGACTATLVAPDVILTAAHCFGSAMEGSFTPPTVFLAGLDGDSYAERAGIADYFINPAYEDHGDIPLGQGNGEDWAFARLDRPIGETLGWLDVWAPSEAEWDAIVAGEAGSVSQGGYSWDTGNRLSGHIDCPVVAHYPDASILHQCDTVQGDSGSPFFIERPDGEVAIIAVESTFYPAPQGSDFATDYLAVDARAFAEPLARYIAGEDPLPGEAGGIGGGKPGTEETPPAGKHATP